MKKFKLLGTLIILFAVTGCYDGNEPNDYAYVVAIGVDKAEDEGEYEISIQFAKPTQISGGGSEEGGSGGETLGLVTVKAPTVYTGINIANNIVSKRFQLSHTKIVVVSEEIARGGIRGIIDTIVRSNDLRPNMYIAVARESAKEYLASVEPEMEINPVKYYQLIFENEAAEFVPKNVSQNVYFYTESKEREVVLPVVSKSKEDKKKSQDKEGGGESGGGKSEGNDAQKENIEIPETGAKSNSMGFEYMLKEYIAGNVEANKKNKSEAIGMAIFDGDRMVGEMNEIETELYNIINGGFESNYNTFYNDEFPQRPMVMSVRQYRPPAARVRIVNGNPKIFVKISMEGSLISVEGDVIVEEDIYNYEEKIEKYIEDAAVKFLNRTSKEFGTDIMGFGTKARKNFADYSEFLKYEWKDAYKRAEFKVDVDFTIRRTGLIIKNSGK